MSFQCGLIEKLNYRCLCKEGNFTTNSLLIKAIFNVVCVHDFMCTHCTYKNSPDSCIS